MRVLLTNDDGYHAKGLQALAEAMGKQLMKQGDWEMFSK